MSRRLDIVFVGLTLSSSWGNGHATTYRGLIRALCRRGHRVAFLERDVPWYAGHRDLARPDFCDLRYYRSVGELRAAHGATIRDADAVVAGSFVPEGRLVVDALAELARGRLCFYDIDTPVTLARLAAGDREHLAPEQVRLFDIYFSFTGGPTLERLERDFGARRALPLHCAADPDLHRPTGEAPRWDLGYLGTFSSDRQPALEELLLEPARRLPRRRFVVAGPQYPDAIDWPANVERISHVPPQEHPSFYSRQRYTLNLTRADMVAAGWSPSVRLFEAAACGTPLISDDWPGIGSFFPSGEAIHVARSAAEVVHIVSGETEAARQRMAEAARRRVLTAHTADARAGELAAHLGSRVRAAPVAIGAVETAA
jgi:spore maturation protein CgeB